LDGLEKIQTRGYDGAGIATMSPSGGTMVSNNEKLDKFDIIAMLLYPMIPTIQSSILNTIHVNSVFTAYCQKIQR
jgi:hypothetical protein